MLYIIIMLPQLLKERRVQNRLLQKKMGWFIAKATQQNVIYISKQRTETSDLTDSRNREVCSYSHHYVRSHIGKLWDSSEKFVKLCDQLCIGRA